jgi:mono/diheme cytochrome c family protein
MRGRRRRGAAALAAGLACVAAPAAILSSEENLPPGPGRRLLAQACAQCHQLRPIVTQRKGEADWRRTVDEMVWRGAPLMPGEAAVLARYLADAFGPQTQPGAQERGPAPDPEARRFPPGSARPLVLQACVGCHDLATTLMRRQTADEWRRSVDLMVRLGARLEPAEIDTVADYIAGFLGPDARSPGGGRP